MCTDAYQIYLSNNNLIYLFIENVTVKGRTIRKVMGGGGGGRIFEPQEFVFVIKLLV